MLLQTWLALQVDVNTDIRSLQFLKLKPTEGTSFKHKQFPRVTVTTKVSFNFYHVCVKNSTSVWSPRSTSGSFCNHIDHTPWPWRQTVMMFTTLLKRPQHSHHSSRRPCRRPSSKFVALRFYCCNVGWKICEKWNEIYVLCGSRRTKQALPP